MMKRKTVIIGVVLCAVVLVALTLIGSTRPELVYACAVVYILPVILCFLLGAKGMIRDLGKVLR